MPAELPVIRIYDTDFYVDLRGMQFIQVGQPANRIRFDDVQDDRTECRILFDTATKNAFQGNLAELRRSSTVVEVRLPSLAELDPPTLAALIIESRLADESLLRAARALQQINEQRKQASKQQKKR